MVDRTESVTTNRVGSPVAANRQRYRTESHDGPAFQQVLSETLRGEMPLKFSIHAQRRLQSRDIQLADGDISKIQRAVDKASEKGSKESLVLLDNVALVVSIKNRVVVTALNVPDIKERIVTNIDSVVLA